MTPLSKLQQEVIEKLDNNFYGKIYLETTPNGDNKKRKELKQFILNTIEEAYKSGREEKNEQICNASMMIETVLGYLEMGNSKLAVHHLEVAQSILCPELQSLKDK